MNDTKFTISNLSLDEVNALLAALQELPAKICNPMTQKIRTQAEAQLQAASPAAETPATE